MTARSRLKSAAKWAAVVAVTLSAYVASQVFVSYFCNRHAPALSPVIRALYAPLELYYVRHPTWPGSRSYVQYEEWVYQQLQRLSGEQTDLELYVMSQLEFNDVSLNVVAEYVSKIHEYPIELTPDTDGDVLVTLKATAPLRDHLGQITRPHGLVFGVIENRVVIGPPATVENLVTQADAAAHPHRFRNNVIAIVGLALFIAVIVLLLRRRAARRRAVTNAAAGC